MSNLTFTSVAVLKAKDGKREALREALLQLISPTRKETGCLYYILFEDKNSPGTFYMREAFRDQSAFDFHTQTDHFKNFVEKAVDLDLMDGPIDLKELTEVSDPNHHDV